MSVHTIRRTVQWGDCDPMGIIFYPNFYRWIDEASWALFHSRGVTTEWFMENFGIHGTPLIETGCVFRSPVKPGDRLTVEARIAEWTTRTMRLKHHFACGERAVADGFEVRVWVTPDASAPDGIRSAPIPDAVRERLQGPPIVETAD